MGRLRNQKPSLELIFFATPEQKLVKLLLSEPTTTFPIRVLASRLKGIRGLGGFEGINSVLKKLEGLGLVEFLDHHRAVRLKDENPYAQLLKRFVAAISLEDLKDVLTPISNKGILFGSWASGKAQTKSDYDLLVVSDLPEEVKKAIERHPLGKKIDLHTRLPEQYSEIEDKDENLAKKLGDGIVLWGTTW